jgi:hypothetical protein
MLKEEIVREHIVAEIHIKCCFLENGPNPL